MISAPIEENIIDKYDPLTNKRIREQFFNSIDKSKQQSDASERAL